MPGWNWRGKFPCEQRPRTGPLPYSLPLISLLQHLLSRPCLRPLFLLVQKYKVVTEMLLLQVAADNYKVEPEEQFETKFQVME